MAEDTGLINELGRFVLETACREAAKWPEHVRIAVNVSPVQFRSQALPLKVAAALAETGLDPRRLERETRIQDFFVKAPALNPNRAKITGTVCGVRVETGFNAEVNAKLKVSSVEETIVDPIMRCLSCVGQPSSRSTKLGIPRGSSSKLRIRHECTATFAPYMSGR